MNEHATTAGRRAGSAGGLRGTPPTGRSPDGEPTRSRPADPAAPADPAGADARAAAPTPYPGQPVTWPVTTCSRRPIPADARARGPRPRPPPAPGVPWPPRAGDRPDPHPSRPRVDGVPAWAAVSRRRPGRPRPTATTRPPPAPAKPAQPQGPGRGHRLPGRRGGPAAGGHHRARHLADRHHRHLRPEPVHRVGRLRVERRQHLPLRLRRAASAPARTAPASRHHRRRRAGRRDGQWPPRSRPLVDINTNLSYENEQAAGTGIVLTSNGEILTNNHVIDGATSISVTDIGNGQTYKANVVGYDRTGDVAVIQLVGAPRPPDGPDRTGRRRRSARVSWASATPAAPAARPSSAGGSVTVAEPVDHRQ